MKRNNYIGGEFTFDLAFDREIELNNDLLNDDNYLFLSSGRDALKTVLLNLPVEHSSLLPSYLCESIVQPFKQLKRKYEFYRIKDNLTADIDYLDSLLKNTNHKIVYVINYFGFMDKKLLDYLSKSYPDITIILDYSHNSYLRNINYKKISGKTFIILSLRKCFPVVDGGILVNTFREKIKTNFVKKEKFKFVDYKLTGKLLKQAYLNNDLKSDFIENQYLKYFELSEKLLDNKKSINFISEISKRNFNNLDIESINKTRFNNFKHLLDMLFNNKFNDHHFSLIFKSVNKDEFPYMLPIRVIKNKRDNLRKYLSDNQVFCPVIWKLPYEIKWNKYYDSVKLSYDILCFPIDQRYNSKDMNKISRLVEEYYTK